MGWSKRIALKHVYHQGWNRSPAQVGCMRQVLRAGALGRPRGMGWGGRWERGSGWGTHVNPWLIHVNVWQKPLQYYKVISLQLIKIKKKKKQALVYIKGKLSVSIADLHAMLYRLATLNYPIQFYGLFYEKLLFSLSWTALKGNRERQKRTSINLVKIVPPWSMPRPWDYLNSPLNISWKLSLKK